MGRYRLCWNGIFLAVAQARRKWSSEEDSALDPEDVGWYDALDPEYPDGTWLHCDFSVTWECSSCDGDDSFEAAFSIWFTSDW